MSQLDLKNKLPEKSKGHKTSAETNGIVNKENRSEEVKCLADGSDAEAWIDLFTKNRAAEKGMNLDYITPNLINGQQVVELAQDEVEKELQKWKSSLIAYFIGETPGYKAMQRYVQQF